MPSTKAPVLSLAVASLLAAACAESSIDSIDLPQAAGSGGTGGSSAAGGSGGGGTSGSGGATGTGGASATGGVGATGGTGGASTAGNAGTPAATGGGAGAGAGGTGGLEMGGTAGVGADSTGGMAGTGTPMGGTAGTGGSLTGGTAGMGAEAGSAGSAGAPPAGPYAPRTGSFKVLVYSKTGGFTHTEAILAGKPMLTAMGMKQGFEVAFSEDPADVNAQNLAQYEVFFGLNPTGGNLGDAQKADFEAWMTTKNGAFAGVHSSTDHENHWAFWSEVTGQYFNDHDFCCTQQNIQWDAGATDFVAVVGLPSPWSRSEEWYKFNTAAAWSAKPGFKILSRVTTSGGGTRPVSFVREWGNFRSFYTSLGHQDTTYSDPQFIRHVAAGIMWAARREALFKP
jgi:hypothetical protein